MQARRFLVVTLVAWGAIILMSTVEVHMYLARSGSSISFAWTLGSQAPGWVVWMLATAPVVRLTRRLPLWPLRLRAIAAHVVVAVGIGICFVLVGMLADRVFPWPRSAEPDGLIATVWKRLVGWSPSILMAYGGLVGAGHARAYAEQVQREQREKAALATQLVEAQLGALRMQLQPHFLFNTLNSIAMLVRGADNARAVEMIALLGDVLRTLLRSSSDLEATLDAELALLRRYLEIEEIRFGDRLRVRWAIEPGVAHAQVPSLILQPVVENALRHGLWPRADGGELVITARRVGDALALEVADDGVGLTADFALAHTRGVGLTNVRTRLAQMYGEAGALEVSSRQPRGVRVELRLPFHVEPRFDGDARSVPG